MKWEIEAQVEDVGKGKGCLEDLAGVSGAMAWILDGAAAVSPGRVTEAPSDAQWIVQRLDAELRQVADQSDRLERLVAVAIQRTAARAQEQWIGVPDVPPSAALGVVRGMAGRCEFFVLADVSVIVRTDAGVVELTDERVDRDNDAARRAMAQALAAGVGFHDAKALTQPHLAERRRRGMNRPDGYWVASLDPAAACHAFTGAIDGVREVVLATDGFMRAAKLFGLVTDLEELFSEQCDFRRLVAQVRKAEDDDPDTLHFPRWSVHDDICARRLRWVD
jgi:hypothetical protein